MAMTTRLLMGAAALLALSPLHAMAQEVGESRPRARRDELLGAEYTLVKFAEDDVEPWHLGSFSYRRRSEEGTILARVNVASRFSTTGMQTELEAYPRINDIFYAYLNLGYSSSSIFPDWRSGGELFTNLPNAWEGSLGYRQLRYDGHPITLITGAVGKYVGNYWVSVRPFVRPSSSGTTATTLLQARRYFADGDHFVGARFGVGNAPPDLQPPDAASLAREHSVSVAVHGSGDLAPRLLGTWLLGYERERLLANRTRTGVSASAGVRVRL